MVSFGYPQRADLANANLQGARLDDADLSDADLSGAIFEPETLPRLEGIAQAHGLQLMTYQENPGPLAQLRTQLEDAGFRAPERAIPCALNRRQAELDSPIERWFKLIAFDWTCQYGLS